MPRYEDLSPAVKKQVDAAFGRGGRRAKPSRAGTGDGQPCEYRCDGCAPDEPSFPNYLAWEKHAKQAGHRRGRLASLDPPSPQE